MKLILGVPIISTGPQQPFHQISEQISKTWTDEQFCILKMGSSCPSGFDEDQIKLSVQTDVNPKDTGSKGEELIKLGKGGETELTRSVYDSLYTLTLTMCCKKPK